MLYDQWLDNALRTIVHKALKHVFTEDMPAGHGLYLTFDTQHSDVELPEDLYKRYPTEMTIVLEHEFWDLTVTPDSFSVKLSFDDVPYRIKVPFSALIAFADPSVQFFLQFNTTEKSKEAKGALAAGGHKKETAAKGPKDNIIPLFKDKKQPKKDG